MIIITEKKTKERTKPKHHRIENYDILSNGFFFLRSSLSAVSVSPYTSNLAARCCFLFFSLCCLFRLKAHTHCAPWRLLLRLFAASTDITILMDFSRLPKKKSRKQEKIFFRGSLSSFMIVVEHNHWISQGWRCFAGESRSTAEGGESSTLLSTS